MTKEEEEEAKKDLEEDFEWFRGEYSDQLPSCSQPSHNQSVSQPRIAKFCSDDNIREDSLRENKTMPCLKFQVNSDEDSSDNAGSRSPLLCRHVSLEKGRYTFEEASGPPSEHKTLKGCHVGKPGKTPLTVYCDTAVSTPDDLSK